MWVIVSCFGLVCTFCVRLLLCVLVVLFYEWLTICLVDAGLCVCWLMRVLRGGVLGCYSDCWFGGVFLFVGLVKSFLLGVVFVIRLCKGVVTILV